MSTQNNQGNNDLAFWIAVIVLFCTGLWPISVFLLIRKFLGSGKKKSTTGRTRHPYDIQREWEETARKAEQSAQQTWQKAEQTADQAWQKADSAVDRIWRATEQVVNKAEEEFRKQTSAAQTTKSSSAKKATQSGVTKGQPKAKKVKVPRGTGLIIAGAIVSGLFGLSTMAASLTFLESLFMGYFFADELMGILIFALFLVGGLVLLGSGIGRRRKGKRYLRYLGLIGTRKTVSITALAKTAGIGRRRVLDDLQDMLDKNILSTGYLDLSRDLLVLSADGIPDEEPAAKAQRAPEPEPAQDDNAILAQIRAVNDAIPDPVMSEKIDRIEEITGKILDYQRKNPGKDSQLRSFLNYYLPTTLKILNSYAQLDAQGVEGENITAAKKRIEGMMDKVVEGFENQLDKLFADSAMDISSDVAVLEQMLQKDGLSGNNQGMTL